ncbi:MAG: TPR end-of-group domain-containing protein [Longimicrobiales bacterium]
MIRFHGFGNLDLRNGSGAEVRSVLSQPKRTALLAYLAAASPGSLTRRGTLLALFWPDLDEAHARNALSKSIHHLRQSLGTDAMVSRGNEELGLAPDHIWCDAVAFHTSHERDPEALQAPRAVSHVSMALALSPEATARPSWSASDESSEVLYEAGQWREARDLFEARAARNSADGNARGYLGKLAARRGDTTEAERAIQWSTARSDYATAAQIAALLGDRQRALEYLRRALSLGMLDNNLLHRAQDLELLHDDPEFKALQRPVG